MMASIYWGRVCGRNFRNCGVLGISLISFCFLDGELSMQQLQSMHLDEDEYEPCILTLSRASSTGSEMSLVRVCSYNSNTEEDMLKSQQRFLAIDTIFHSVENICRDIMELTLLDKDLVLLLLHKYKWNTEVLKEQYCLVDSHYYHHLQKQKHIWEQNILNTRGKCPVCHEEQELLQNICGHSVCLRCWREYLAHCVGTRRGFCFTCFAEGCEADVFHSMILRVLLDKHRYMKSISIEYILNTKSLSFCPGAQCDYCFEDTSCQVRTVTCIGCKTIFCFKCAMQPHEPCTCKEASEWFSLTKREKYSELWIKQNTKSCPHCHLPVQKVVGCDYIVCACMRKFCYKCSRDWDQSHSSHFSCPNEKEIVESRVATENNTEETREVGRYYTSFFLNQEKIRAFKDLKVEQLREKIQQQTHLPEQETLFMLRAKEICVKVASVIKWAEIFEFFQRAMRTVSQHHLAHLKSDMNTCAEFLSELDKKVSKLFATSQFLQAPGSKIKDFYREKERGEDLIRSLEKSLKYYFTQINRE